MRNVTCVASVLALLSLMTGTPIASAQSEAPAEETALQDRGTVRVSLTIPDIVRINGADSIQLKSQHDTGTGQLCIRKNANSTARIRATGSNLSSAFVARNGDLRKTYSVTLAGHVLQAGQSIPVPSTDGPGHGDNIDSQSGVSCSKGNGTPLTVQLHTGNAVTAQASGYADVLTLVIEST